MAQNRSRHFEYFRKQNDGENDKITRFEAEYDGKTSDIQHNMEWLKINIRGHDYFGYTSSSRISYSDYVRELPESAFEDILTFFDSLDFFSRKRIRSEVGSIPDFV